MNKGKYFITPYIVELMTAKVPFLIFYNNPQLLEGDEVQEWIDDQDLFGDGLMNAIYKDPYMIGRHITTRKGSGYVLKDTRVVSDVKIPDEIIKQGYISVVKSFEDAKIEII
jgi:hypothetical protein